MDETNKKPGPFDLETVRALIEMMDTHDISEVSLKEGDRILRLRRGSLAPVPTMLPQMMPMPTPMPTPSLPTAVPSTTSTPTPSTSTANSKPFLEIKSPTVGTFYAKPAPDKEDYVKVGTRVTSESVVCKIEAMKIFNDLQAGVNGTIVEILVQNGQYVEYDQVLFRVDPS